MCKVLNSQKVRNHSTLYILYSTWAESLRIGYFRHHSHTLYSYIILIIPHPTDDARCCVALYMYIYMYILYIHNCPPTASHSVGAPDLTLILPDPKQKTGVRKIYNIFKILCYNKFLCIFFYLYTRVKRLSLRRICIKFFSSNIFIGLFNTVQYITILRTGSGLELSPPRRAACFRSCFFIRDHWSARMTVHSRDAILRT